MEEDGNPFRHFMEEMVSKGVETFSSWVYHFVPMPNKAKEAACQLNGGIRERLFLQ
jgi:hypothetical protein